MSKWMRILVLTLGATVLAVAGAVWAGGRNTAGACGTAANLPGSEALRLQAGDGNCLQVYQWLPAGTPAGAPMGAPMNATARAVAVLVHGLGDHPGRYQALVRALNEQGIAVLAADLRGHGGSGGARQRIDSVAQAAGDAEAVLREAARRHPGAPLLLYGHSMGGLIAATVAAGPATGRPPLAGVVLSSAALALPASAGSGARAVVGTLSTLAPGLGLEALDPARVVRDPAARAELAKDPAVQQAKVPARTVASILDGVIALQPRMGGITQPLLVLHGGADRVTEPAGSRALAERAAAKDKKLVIIDPALHSLLHEPEGPAVLREIVGFMAARRGAAAPG